MKASITSARREGKARDPRSRSVGGFGAGRGVSLWAAAFWLLVWQLAARWVNEPLLLVSPFSALNRLTELVREAAFWRAVWFTVGRILLGYAGSCVAGIGLAVLAYRLRLVRQLLSPLTATVKAIPVASFVILALLWVSSKNLSVLVSLLIGFPILYTNVLAGLDSTDPKLLEMARVFRVPFSAQLRTLYLHQAVPFLRSGMGLAMGLCWKSGVAAEVIGIPSGSIGERLYTAKVYLETPDLFCWTLVIVLLSVGCERLLGWLMSRVGKGV